MKAAKSLGFLGAGNMAQALIRGVIAAGVHRASDVQVSDSAAQQRRRARSRFGVASTDSNADLVRRSKVVVLAVKPQVLPQVLEEVRAEARPSQLFVSIAAGVPISRIERGLGGDVRVLRVMPNTPALLGLGMSVLVPGRHATRRDVALAMKLFRSIGDAVAVEDEALIDPVTGLSGSGPAYVYRFAEALIAGGVEQGLSPELARRLAFQTITGAAAMMQRTKESPAELRQKVSSPGGTTLAGLGVMEQRNFEGTVRAAIGAATARSRELGAAAKEAN